MFGVEEIIRLCHAQNKIAAWDGNKQKPLSPLKTEQAAPYNEKQYQAKRKEH